MKYIFRWLNQRCDLSICAIFVGPLILFGPMLFTGKALFWGTPLLQFTPWRALAWEILKTGQIPLWNPLIGMGAPLIANYQSALFYPPNWLLIPLAAIGDAPLIAWGQTLLVMLHLIWAGMGMRLLGKRLGLNRLAQAVSGVAYSMSGYLVGRAGFLSINAAAAWLPWIIYLVTVLVEDQAGAHCRFPFLLTRNMIYLILGFGMLLLAGHAQTAWYIILLSIGWTFLWGWIQKQRGWAWLGRNLLRVGAAILCGAGLAAVQLLPTAEYLMQSQRASAVSYELAMTYSFWPWRFLTLLAPDLFGNPAHGDYWGYGNYWEDAVYIGLAPFLLAAAAIFRYLSIKIRKRSCDLQIFNHQLFAFLMAVIFLAFVLAIGNNTPIFPFLYRYVPTFDMFQAPTRLTILAIFAMALLAGYGVNILSRPEGRALYWARLGIAGTFAILIGVGLVLLFLKDIKPSFIRATALMGLWGLGFGFLYLFAPKRNGKEKQSLWEYCVAGMVICDLVVAHAGLNPAAPADLYDDSKDYSTTNDLVDSHRIYMSADDEYDLKFSQFFKFKTFHIDKAWIMIRDIYLPNTSILNHVSSANNFDPLVPERYSKWMDMLNDAAPEDLKIFLSMMDVSVLEKYNPKEHHLVDFETVSGASRLQWSDCVIEASNGEDALKKVVEGVKSRIPDKNPLIVVEGFLSGDSQDVCLSADHETNLRILAESPNLVTIDTRTGKDGWLLLADTWYPGWEARIDGVLAPVHRGNYLFRTVHLPAGNHRVVFEYRPKSFYSGALITSLILVYLLCSAIYEKSQTISPEREIRP